MLRRGVVQRAQVGFGVRGFGGMEGGFGIVDAVVVVVVVAGLVVVVVDARVGFEGSMMGVRVRVGSASVGFVREREGGWIGVQGFRGGCFDLGGWLMVVVLGVVEVRLVMRRGRGMRLRSVMVEVEVIIGGCREGAERLWEIEGGKAIG